MANHAYVKVRKPNEMTVESVTKVLEDLNRDRFKNCLKINYYNCHGDKSAWGPDVWELVWTQDNGVEQVKHCWLNSKKSFEIRHGNGSHFGWWVDCCIVNVMAFVHNGKHIDDGDGEICKGDNEKYKTFIEYLKVNYFDRFGTEFEKYCLNFENECVPTAFKMTMKDFE